MKRSIKTMAIAGSLAALLTAPVLAQTVAAPSNATSDPYVQRRVDNKAAKDEYNAKKDAAKGEYKQQVDAAKGELKAEKKQNMDELKANK